MNRLPTPPTIDPSAVRLALSRRVDVLADLIDRLTVDAESPILATQLSLSVGTIASHITRALDNSAGGANVVPHLIATLDAMTDELRKILPDK